MKNVGERIPEFIRHISRAEFVGATAIGATLLAASAVHVAHGVIYMFDNEGF